MLDHRVFNKKKQELRVDSIGRITETASVYETQEIITLTCKGSVGHERVPVVGEVVRSNVGIGLVRFCSAAHCAENAEADLPYVL